MGFSLEHDDTTRSTLRRAAIVKVDDSGTQQKVDLTGLKNEKPQKIVRVLPHGFTSNPPAQSEGVLFQMGGRSDRSLFLGGEHKDYRQKNLPQGAAVLYDSSGNVIFAKTTSGIVLDAKKGVISLYSETDKVWVKPAPGKIVYLGGDGTDGTYDFVVTNSGPSINVKARIA